MENKESAFIKGIKNTDNNKEILDLSFTESHSLEKIELGIKEASKKSAKLQLSICLAMYRIWDEALFVSANYNSFNDYVKSERVLPKQTAYEYAYIGRYWKELEPDLKRIGFTEEDGLTKLKLFPKHIKDGMKETILEHLKKDSVRQFKVFVSSLRRVGGQEVTLVRKEEKEISTLNNSQDMIDSTIKYINMRKKGAHSSSLAAAKNILDYLSFLVEEGTFDVKLYNLIVEETK